MRKHVLVFVIFVASILASSCQKQQQPATPASAAIDSNKYYPVLLTNGSA